MITPFQNQFAFVQENTLLFIPLNSSGQGPTITPGVLIESTVVDYLYQNGTLVSYDPTNDVWCVFDPTQTGTFQATCDGIVFDNNFDPYNCIGTALTIGASPKVQIAKNPFFSGVGALDSQLSVASGDPDDLLAGMTDIGAKLSTTQLNGQTYWYWGA